MGRDVPETTGCEAGDGRAEEMCEALGGVLPEGLEGNSSGDGWKAYLLSGTARPGDTFAEGGSGDNPGTNTEPETPTMTTEELQAFADAHCLYTASRGTGCTGILNADGTISVCEDYNGTVDEVSGECAVTTEGAYEAVYNPDGTKKYQYVCTALDNGHCYWGTFQNYNTDGSYTQKIRRCAGAAAISKDSTCPNGQYSMYGYDSTYDSHQNMTSQFQCSSVNSSGQCTAYSYMETSTRSYDGNTQLGHVNYQCASISGTTCNNYNATSADYKTSEGTNIIGCYNSAGNSRAGNADGTCPSGYSWKQFNNKTKQHKTCSSYASINWATASC